MNEASDLCPSRLATQFCHIREGRGNEVGLTFLTAPELACVPRIQVHWVSLRCLSKFHHAASTVPPSGSGAFTLSAKNPIMLPPQRSPRKDLTLSSGLNRWLRTFLE